MYAYTVTDTSVTVFSDGKPYMATDSHPNFQEIKERVLREETDGLLELFDQEQAVIDYTDGNISVTHGVVSYKGEPVHNVLDDKILGCMSEGVMYKRLIRFLDKLMDNPSRRSVNELYRFLEHKNMPITPEGDFIAYKGVNSNFTDKYTGKFDNSVGKTLEMSRNTVCDDANIGCSEGFHAGSYDYAKGYASSGGNLMVVEIDPSDVVSVPHDCDCQKLRTSKYKVVGHYEHIENAPLDDGLNEDYWDGDYDSAYDEGYAKAKQDMLDNLND